MQKSSKKIIKKYNNWEEIFASAKPMKFNTFNTGRITGKTVISIFLQNFDRLMANSDYYAGTSLCRNCSTSLKIGSILVLSM